MAESCSTKSLDYWRKFFNCANADIFQVIKYSILVASVDFPAQFLASRDQITEILYTCWNMQCSNRNRVELQTPEGGGTEDNDDETSLGTQKESKRSSSEEENEPTVSNVLSTSSRPDCQNLDEFEALTDEIEEQQQTLGEVLRIKDILTNWKEESEKVLSESLRRLQLMELTVENISATDIGRAVSGLHKHKLKPIRLLARTLIKGWKLLVEEWVAAAAAPAQETSPASVNPSPHSVNPSPLSVNPSPLSVNPSPLSVDPSPCSVNPSPLSVNPLPLSVDPSPRSVNPSPLSVNPSPAEEEPLLPSELDFPPLDMGALLATQTASFEFSKFFDGMDEDGNPTGTKELKENGRRPQPKYTGGIPRQEIVSARERKPSDGGIKKGSEDDKGHRSSCLPEKTSAKVTIPRDIDAEQKKNCSGEVRRQDVVRKPPKPQDAIRKTPKGPDMPCTPPVHVRPPARVAANTSNQQRPKPSGIPVKPSFGKDTSAKESEELIYQRKLAVAKRKLQDRYEEAKNAKKQRTIQVMELKDLPKQGQGQGQGQNRYQVRNASHFRRGINDRSR